ncbi:MAG TPA: gluconate 2-dehydrogenase subunit 3 family protein [Bryobacteraceae bacterium]|nr:gluconate 2-dehydrogenase subunit 3 family protein [Bryobacteraceae bacterium]
MQIDRRTLLLALAAPLYAAAPLKTFSVTEAALVEALCERIIPADDVAGAKEAGVLYYLDAQLAGPLKRFAADYHGGLPALQNFCRQLTGADFLELPAEERTKCLMTLEKTAPPELRAFFRLVVEQTMQGFYGSPAHGGNRNDISWRMLGVEEVMGGHGH